MIEDVLLLKPRYNEVDQMGYVYHANYVTYCHTARTELMRKYQLHDAYIEEQEIMMPVIEMNLKYKNPAHYDETLEIKTKVLLNSSIRLSFSFEIKTEEKLICIASTTIVFVDKSTRKPMKIPQFVKNKLTLINN